MGIFKMQLSEVYEMDDEDLQFVSNEADMYLEAMKKARK